MHERFALSGLLASLLLSGCAGFVTTNGDKGVEVYRPALCLLVTDQAMASFTCPNLASKYEIKPRSFLAKNDFSVELEDGMLTNASDSLDTTALLTFFMGAAELGSKAAGLPVSAESLEGSIGLDPGFYFWDGTGGLRRIE